MADETPASAPLTPRPAPLPVPRLDGQAGPDWSRLENAARPAEGALDAPLVALRKLGAARRTPIVPLRAPSPFGGDDGAGPGSGLGTRLEEPEPPGAVRAPTLRKLSLAAPPPTAFPLPEAPGHVVPRLLENRPPQGYPSLDDEIRAVFDVYRQPGETHAYFRLTIHLKERSRVPPIPKDVLFLVDISHSISVRELRSVREGIGAYLDGLGPEDRFNVVAFSEHAFFLHPEAVFVPAARYRRGDADSFIRRRSDERRTNVFQAVQLILSGIPETNRPCNVFLVSDGKATHGTSDVRALVHGFQRVNRDNFSIFAFNAGPGGNLYLLSLLAYRSRGQLESEPDYNGIAGAMEGFARRYDAPVLTNVVASYTNIETEDVYPDVLPNLYRDGAIVFWGRTTPGREVALRVAGQGRDGPREFFFRATVPEGDPSNPEIVRGWAEGKAHALMAALGDEPEDEALRAELLALARRYDLTRILEVIDRGRRRFW